MTVMISAWEGQRYFQVALGLVLMFVGGQVCIPIQPVPITFQTLSVLLVAFLIPYRAAIRAVTSYIVLGAVGLPIWAGYSCGWVKLWGPSGGYFAGFVLAIHVVGRLRLRQSLPLTYWRVVWLCLVGHACIHALGVGWLAYMMGDVHKALQCGCYPFILLDVVKSVFVSYVVCLCLKK